MKFHQDNLYGFQVIEWTQFVRQTDGWTDNPRKNNMSPTPKGGRHKKCKEYLFDILYNTIHVNKNQECYIVIEGLSVSQFHVLNKILHTLILCQYTLP